MVTQTRKSETKSLSLNRSRAREMRHKPVSTEELFWSEVRNRKLGGFKFKRQVLIGPYIVDFVLANFSTVLVSILHVLTAPSPQPSPPLRGGEGAEWDLP